MDVRIKAAFLSRNHRNMRDDAHCQTELPLWQKYHAKNYSAFFISSYYIMKHFLKVSQKILKLFVAGYTVHAPQCNLMLTDNYHVWC